MENVDVVCNIPDGTTDPCEIECQDWFNSNYGDEFGFCNREAEVQFGLCGVCRIEDATFVSCLGF